MLDKFQNAALFPPVRPSVHTDGAFLKLFVFVWAYNISGSGHFWKWWLYANHVIALQTELKNDCACVTFEPVGQSRSRFAQSAWHLARKYRLEQHIPNETLDFAVKFRLVFRYETVEFRRYVLALSLVGLSRKFEAYLVYLTLIWGKFPRRYSCFQNSAILVTCFPVFPRELVTCTIIFQLCPCSLLCSQLEPVASRAFLYTNSAVSYWAHIVNRTCSSACSKEFNRS